MDPSDPSAAYPPDAFDPSDEDDDSHEEGQLSSSAEDSSAEEDEEDIYPPEFPLSPAIYEPHEIAEDEAEVEVRKEDRDPNEFQNLVSLYPISFLNPNGIMGRPDPRYTPLPIGQYRKEMYEKMAASGAGGEMQYVEFVPPWTDPDWSSRFVFMGQPGQDPVNDPQYKMYAKQGLMQGQRPALRDEDLLRDLTPASKRYGVDASMTGDAFYGKSGVTPTQGNFNIQLGNPRVTPSNQGVRNVVDKDDYDALYNQYRNVVAGQGGFATEDDFRRVLQHVVAGNLHPALGLICDAEVAGALLQYMNGVEKMALNEEYQRVIFGGSTSNELVETGVWTMDKTANSDLVTPLHDFFTRDKFEVTTHRGTVPDRRLGVPLESRKVYSFPTQQGEYCAANDYFWLAIQPALQLATMVLNSDHPATWAWADIYRMRPCQDSRRADNQFQDIRTFHRSAGVTRKDYFSVHLDEDPDEFYPEVARLKEMGFESVPWVCELLKECLIWEFNARYTNNSGASQPWDHQMAWTEIRADRRNREVPFIIRISLSVDYIWPLLIDEYSQAEKAACSFTLASTMVHELCHAIVYARCQLFHMDRIWLRFNPAWEGQIGNEALNLLQVFGYRQIWDDQALDQDLLAQQSEGNDFFEDEDDAEEGWATENQYWGGAPDSLGKGNFLPQTRFLNEVLTMVSFNSWPRLEQPIFKAIPFAMFERFFTQSFWDQELQKWGPEAMKTQPLTAPRAYSNWSVFRWNQIELRCGYPARRWMQDVCERLKFDDEHALLWIWLCELTKLAVAPKSCMVRWSIQQVDWKRTDKLLWTIRNDCKDKATLLVAYLQQLYNDANPLPPIDYGVFKNAFVALSRMHRSLSHDVSTYQIITVDYHRQTDAQTKTDIQNFYAPSLRARLDAIHSKIAADCIQFLDVFESIAPTVLVKISQNAQAVDLLDNDRKVLREKFVALQHAIRPVRLSFDVNYQAFVFNIQDFPGIKPITAQDTAKRIEKTAKKQLRQLSGPLLTIAQGWISILERGERLRNAAEGTPDGELNKKLTDAANFVSVIKQRHQIEAARQHQPPGENMTRMLSNPGLLQPNQVSPDASMRAQRFNTTSSPGQINTHQTLYAEASGFVPYRDPRTGLTRFHRANIPTEAGPSVNPMAAAQAQAQGQSLVGTFSPGRRSQAPVDDDAAFAGLMQGLSQTPPRAGAPPDVQPGEAAGGGNALDAMRALIGERGRQVQASPEIAGHVVPSIYNRALQTVAGPNGAALINNNVPGANNLFGMSAAQNSMVIQQLEVLIRQSGVRADPTLESIGAQQGGMQAPGAGLAPANQLYDPVGDNGYQAFQPGQPMYQQQAVPIPPQAPFPPGGGFVAPNVFPPPQPPQFPPPGGYQGPNVFPPPQAPSPPGNQGK